MTILEIIERSAARLIAAGASFGHGTSNAFDEACWLVLWKLGLPLDDLDSVAGRMLDAEHCAGIDDLLGQRIASRKPAAYLTGEAWLQGVPFHVDERVIVPRSPIGELLVSGAIDPWLGPHTHRMLDLCTGNGSLAILAALSFPDVQVDASDVSADALAVAHINVRRHRLEQRVRLIHCDGLRTMQPARYDLILCNPPYVDRQGMEQLPPEYRAEPGLALDGGADGMDFVRPLLAQVGAFMANEAVLVLEIGHGRSQFEQAFPQLEPVWLDSSAGEDQVLLLERSALAGAAS
jgi:ribosomal protein L3 glutamine methyltransferase